MKEIIKSILPGRPPEESPDEHIKREYERREQEMAARSEQFRAAVAVLMRGDPNDGP